MVYCKNIHFYNESCWPEVNIEKIIAYLNKILPNNVIEKEKKSLLYLNSIDKQKITSFYNQAIVQDLKKPLYIYGLNYYHFSSNYKDKKVVTPSRKIEFIDLLLYDGFLIQKLLQKFLKNMSRN